jgi:hypothetical protein
MLSACEDRTVDVPRVFDEELSELSSLFFLNDNDETRKKSEHLLQSLNFIREGDFESAIQHVDLADKIRPHEVVDYSSWPIRDIIECKSKSLQSQTNEAESRIACALEFEIGQNYCTSDAGNESADICTSEFCDGELFNPIYSVKGERHIDIDFEKKLSRLVNIVRDVCSS